MVKQNKVTEREVRVAFAQALKKTLKQIESEPSRTILESDSPKDDISEQTADEIMAWLFTRRNDNDSTGTGK